MAHIMRIGNSFGVRIPIAIIKQLGFTENTELLFKVTEDGLLITSEKKVRQGWEQKFKSSQKKLKKTSLLGEFPNEF